MLENYIKAGIRIDLSPIERGRLNEEEIEKKVFRTQITEILSDDRLEISMPMEKGRLILLPIDKEFDVFFYTDRGLYQCFGRVINRFKRGNLYLVEMELMSNLRKYQRREFYRFSCSLELDARNLTKDEIESLEKNELNFIPGLPLKKGVIADISGGGLRFLASEKYDVGSLVMCKWHLAIDGQMKEYRLIGKVLYCQEMDSRDGEYEHRLQYVNVDKKEQEEIIRFIFEEERKSRKRETGR